MSITIQEDSQSVGPLNDLSNASSSSAAVETDRPVIVRSDIDADEIQQVPKMIQKLKPLRFAMGLLSTASGVALILGVGLRIIEMRNIGGDFTTPLIGICVLIGLMLLGGGFGVMATSSSGFDEDEFERLAAAGNISAVCESARSDGSDSPT